MAEELYDPEAREHKAFRKVVSASRALAKQYGFSELADAVATANHQDPQIRSMRRMEAVSMLLDALVDKDEASNAKIKAKAEPATASKTEKA